MSNSNLNNYLRETKWLKQFLFDYVLGSGFKPYMGPDAANIIRVVNELKSGGDTVVTPFGAQLRSGGVAGGTLLRGNEEKFNQFADRVIVSMFSNAVTFDKSQTFPTKLDLFNAARKRLKDWSATKLKNDIVTALDSVITTSTADAQGNTIDTAVPFASATDAMKNTYLTTNTDRILVGNNSAQYKTAASGVWSAALAELSGASDVISANTLHNAKAMAAATGLNSGFGINPYSVDDDSGETSFVYFCGPEQLRDLCADQEIKDNYHYAADRGMTNPLFRSGDRMLDGIVIRKIPSLGLVGAVGASGANVARGFLCGQSAVTVAYGQDPTMITDDYSYGQQKGVGIEEIRGTKKTSIAGVNYGVLEVLSATTPATF